MKYKILPFRFERFNDKETFLSNEVGEYIFLSNSEFDSFVNHTLDTKSATFKNLKAKHILTDTEVSPIIDLLAIKYRTKKNFLSDFTSLHMVVTTLRCNSKCSYCQVSSKDLEDSTYDMDKKTAKNVVKTIFESPSQNIKIEFQGGEPLLNFNIIKYIIEYAEWKNLIKKKNLEFVICTNLSLITLSMLKYLSKHRVYISTSIDGPPKIHNTNRPLRDTANSYSIVSEKIALTRKHLGQDSVSALMTTTSFSLRYVEQIINTYIDLGFSQIFLRPLNPYGFAKKEQHKLAYSVDSFIEFYSKGLEYIIDLNRKGTYFVEIFATILLARILTPFSTGYVDLQSPSGVGISGVIYDYNGNVYVSDEGRMLASVGDETFKMGNVNTSSHQELFNSDFLRSLIGNTCLETVPQCSKCAYQSYCGSDPVRNYSEQNDFIGNRPNSDNAKKNKAIIKLLLTYIKQNDPETNRIFWSWLNRTPETVQN